MNEAVREDAGRELLLSLLRQLSSEPDSVVALINAYFDESGTHDGSPVICVAGYLFKNDHCADLDSDWRGILDFYDLPYFHMVDCAHGNNPFNKLSLEERIAAETKAIQVIRKYMTHGFVITAVEAEYCEAMGVTDPFGAAYSWCCWMCLVAVGKWAETQNYNGDIAYFFEAGHKYQSRTDRLMMSVVQGDKMRQEFRYASHTFAAKRKLRPLQTADILAWHGAKFKKDRMTGVRPPRKDFEELVKGGKTQDFHGDMKMFQDFQTWLSEQPEEYRNSILSLVT